MKGKFKCSEYVVPREGYGPKLSVPCTRDGTVERNGSWFCRRHDPVCRAERDAKRREKADQEFQASREHIRERQRRTQACVNACEDFGTEYLEITSLSATFKALTDRAVEQGKSLRTLLDAATAALADLQCISGQSDFLNSEYLADAEAKLEAAIKSETWTCPICKHNNILLYEKMDDFCVGPSHHPHRRVNKDEASYKGEGK